MPKSVILGLCAVLLMGGCEQTEEKPRTRQETATAQKRKAVPKPGLCRNIEEACGRLAGELAGKLPKGKTVAVVPFGDAADGVRRLGVVAADGVQRVLAKKGVRVVERRHLNALLAERNLKLTDLASGRSLGQAGKIAGADVLVVGSTVETGKRLMLSAKAMDADSGRVIAATGNAALSTEGMEQLMWYVRRPPRQRPQGNLPPLAVRYEFVTPRGGGEERLGEGATVRSGQKFKIRVEPNSDCWLYVLLYDSSGAPTVLFPHAKIRMSNEVRGGTSYEIPEGSKWYWFDNVPGTETFYIVAGYTPLTDLDRIVAEMGRAGAASGRLAGAAKQKIDGPITRGMSAGTAKAYQPKGYRISTRGVGGVVDLGWGKKKTVDMGKVDDVVVGHATVVKKLTLRHR